MVERRRADRRHRALKSGKIIVSDKAPKIECTVRNLNEAGACLEISSTTVGLPGNFDLLLDGVRRTCRVTWKTETRMGVVFRP
jgi:hypothetical protein